MPTPQRIIDEAREAEQQMEALRQQNEGEQPAPARTADTHFDVGQQATEIPTAAPTAEATEPRSGPIDAEAYARLQQRLATLEGNFRQTSTELAAERARSETFQRMLEHRAEREPVPATPAPQAAPAVSQTEIETFGEDLTDFIRKLIGEATAPILDAQQRIETALAETRNVATRGAQSAQEVGEARFVERMNALVLGADGRPDWEHINHMHETGDNRFVDWLQKTGEDSDEPRLNIIQRAFQRKDADRCARMINRFKQDVGMADGSKPSAPTPQSESPAAALVSPPTTPASQSPGRGRPPAKTYTIEDVNRHYDEKTKGAWKGKEAEWQRIADDMDRAAVEGRFQDTRRRR